jgi:hypothetical protein
MHAISLNFIGASVLGLLAFGMASCAAPSREMQAIVAPLQTDKYNLDVSNLPRNREMSLDLLADNKELEVYRVPRQSGADIFAYNVYYDSVQHQYWVTRVGGIAAVSDIFGPIKFTKKSE